MTCGIYALTFKGTDKVYIGKSINIEKRHGEHLSSFKYLSTSKKLQGAYNEFGQPSFEILYIGGVETLDKIEEDLIREFDSINNGFNTLPSSNGSTGIYGEDVYSSTHTNKEFIEVFLELLKRPYKTHKEISQIFNVNISFVSAIATGQRGVQLLTKLFPKEYKELELLNGCRKEVCIKPSTTSKYLNEQYIEVIKLLTSSIKKYKHQEISDITKVNINVIRDINSCRRHKWLEQVCPTEWQILISRKQSKN